METREMLEIFDGERRPKGYCKERREKLAPDEYAVAVGIWVVDANGRLLITRRSLEKRYAPGKWENTGGHMRAGEAPVDAVIRELGEETGLKARREDVRYLGTAKVWPYFGDNFVTYVDEVEPQVRLQPGETMDARWVTLGELDAMLSAGEMAASTRAHMAYYRGAFEAAVRARGGRSAGVGS